MTKVQRYLDDDIILSLPQNVIDHILGFLPLRDAARSSVLSTKWRFVWVDLSSLVLDEKFWADIKLHKLSSGLSIDFSSLINRILLHHTGNVVKFVVDISVISFDRHFDTNLCLSALCRKCLRVLSIVNSESNPFTLPSCVYFAPELRNLSISNCIMNMKETNPRCFIRLQSLCLDHITFDSCVLATPHLTSLTLEHCLSIRGFCISAPILVSLVLKRNDDLNLMPYLVCTNITNAYICLNNSTVDLGGVERVNLVKLLSSWPKLAHFTVDGLSLKYLTTGIELNQFSLILKLTHFRAFHVDWDQRTWVLFMIGYSPLLQTVEVWLQNDDMLQTSSVLPLITTSDLEAFKNKSRMEQLHTVKINLFNGSRSALMVVNILLHCAPKLKQMLLGLKVNGIKKYFISLSVTKELIRLQRAYPKVEIILC